MFFNEKLQFYKTVLFYIQIYQNIPFYIKIYQYITLYHFLYENIPFLSKFIHFISLYKRLNIELPRKKKILPSADFAWFAKAKEVKSADKNPVTPYYIWGNWGDLLLQSITKKSENKKYFIIRNMIFSDILCSVLVGQVR